MPPPRRSPPRRKDRRSRSQSPSRERRRSRSPREKRRSRSPYKKRSRSRERGNSPKKRSPERSSPPRRKSLGTKRRSSSPHGYDQPVKRQADSTRRTYRSKSRSHSPVPQKKSRDSRRDDSPPEKLSSRRRSPSPSHSGKYSDRPSSSKSSERRSSKKDEIDFVKIVDMGSKLPKLNKRFQTLEQLAQGGFEFEENITIGIHRGPSHLDLDEDVPVNYDFNPKLFIMLHPKKDYTIPVFERDEILAFHHDDVLDEEAYVEKRTITVKPSDKPKPSTSRYDTSRFKEIDYKITIGSSRDSHGDRRMVHDSGSRSSRYDPEVKIRLDARPDPKYERLYKESRRQEERDLLDDNIQRNPSDLRYNLIRKKSSDDDRDRDRTRGRDSYGDARARIEAKRKGLSDRYDCSRDQSPPPTRLEKRKIGIKTELPDFKNRPENPDNEKPSTSSGFSKFNRWGYCEICNVPINSEKQAIEHVQGTKHIEAENEKRHVADGRSNERKPTALFINGKRVLDGDEESIDPRFNRKTTYNDDDKFQEEWVTNPEITPKGASYYEHDNRSRDDMTFWERKQMFQRTGRYPEKVSLRDRGIRRGRGRDIGRNPVFRPPPKGPRTPAMDDWKHDKFAEVETGDKSADGDGDVVTRYKIDRRKNKDKESSDKKKKGDSDHKRERDIKKEEAALSKDSNISITAV